MSRILVCLLLASFGATAVSQCTWTLLGPGTLTGNVSGPVARYDDGTGPALYVADGNLVIGVGVTTTLRRWDGSSWSVVGTSIDGWVGDLEVYDDGSGPALYMGGIFTTVSGVAASRIARWDGTSWSALGTGLAITSNQAPFVRALHVHEDGTGPALYATGSFDVAGGVTVSSIARWDGAAWSAVGAPPPNIAPQDLATWDDGSGPKLYLGGTDPNFGDPVAAWDGATWSPTGLFYPEVFDFEVYDDGTGPALYAASFYPDPCFPSANIARLDANGWVVGVGLFGDFSAIDMEVFDAGAGPVFLVSGFDNVGTPVLMARNGTTWTTVATLSSPDRFDRLLTADIGAGPTLHVTGSFAAVGGVTAQNIAALGCGSGISLSATQAGPGAGVFFNNANLTPGNEYFNIFSVTPCGGVGAGPYLGLCASNVNDLIWQVTRPLGVTPFHFLAGDGYVNHGPFVLPPALVVDAVCFDFTGAALGPVSPVMRYTVQ